MSEEELNINYIREKTGLVENDELIPIILEMIKESYKSGLCQSEFDNTMGLIEENQELKKQLDTSNELVAQSVQTEMKLRDENIRLRKEYQETYKDVRVEIKEYKNQQKEFIEYLENEIKHYKEHFEFVCKNPSLLPSDDTRIILEKDDLIIQKLERILSKYKEITGQVDSQVDSQV